MYESTFIFHMANVSLAFVIVPKGFCIWNFYGLIEFRWGWLITVA